MSGRSMNPTPLHLTTAKLEVLAPESYYLVSKVEGGEWEAITLGHLHENIALRCADNQREMLSREGKPFEVRLEKMVVVLHEVSVTLQ